jgi:hypothetical protein
MKNINFTTVSKLLFICFFIAASIIVLVDVFTNGAKI